MNCAVVDSANNIVQNIAYVIDLSWSPGLGLFLVPLQEGETCLIGQSYDENDNPRFSGSPIVPKTYTAYQFLTRFTAEERAAFRNAAITDSTVADFQQLAGAAQEVSTDNPVTIAGMEYLVSVGLLTESRKNEILG